jgi:hypothetical protein
MNVIEYVIVRQAEWRLTMTEVYKDIASFLCKHLLKGVAYV